MCIPKILSALVIGGAIVVASSPPIAYAAPFVLQTASNTTGNQAHSGAGVKFAVNSAVSISELGVYDSDQDGILEDSVISAYLLDSVGGVIAFQTFDGLSYGTLTGLYRFKAITPVTLAPGEYYLMGYGWTETNPEHNCVEGGACEAFNDGGGLLALLGSAYGAGSDPAGTFPANFHSGSNYFSAANMRFEDLEEISQVPEPTSMLMLGMGLFGLAGNRLRRKR